jgi:membrane protein DedA with SNARE-associated domain
MNFEQILEFIRYQNEFIIYGILLVSSFIENVFPPFPGDTVTLAGAFVAGEGNVGYAGVLVSATSGGILGMMVLYYLGRVKGRKFIEKRNSRILGKTTLERVERLFGRYGDFIIVISRFLAGMRSAIAIAAGLGNVGPFKMTVLSLVSFLLWNGIIVGLMIVSKSNWQMIKGVVEQYTFIILMLAVCLLIVYIAFLIWRRRKS